jgi:hypothetical protein
MFSGCEDEPRISCLGMQAAYGENQSRDNEQAQFVFKNLIHFIKLSFYQVFHIRLIG